MKKTLLILALGITTHFASAQQKKRFVPVNPRTIRTTQIDSTTTSEVYYVNFIDTAGIIPMFTLDTVLYFDENLTGKERKVLKKDAKKKLKQYANKYL